jgi:hypothetical protein
MRKLVALVAVAMVAACGTPTTSGGGGVTLPSGSQLVAEWREDGGFVPPGWWEIRAPKVAVYSDGTVVSDAHLTMSIPPSEVADLVGTLRRDLAGLPSTVEAHGGNQVADASTATLTVLDASGTLRSVSAYALGIAEGYPDRLIGAREAFGRLGERAGHDGTPFSSDRIRLVASHQDASQNVVRPWPTAIPIPTRQGAGAVRVGDYHGATAAAIRREWPDDVAKGGRWPAAQTSDGQLYLVAWRYLLPHE